MDDSPVVDVDRDAKTAPCPRCGLVCKRHVRRSRSLRDVQRRRLRLHYSVHYCAACRKHFNNPAVAFIAPGSGRYTYAVREAALALRRDGYVLKGIVAALFNAHGFWVPETTLCDWIKAATRSEDSIHEP